MTRERPILFNGPMVHAILAGTKTQTRRLVKGAAGAFWDHGGWTPRVEADDVMWTNDSNTFEMPMRCPHGKPGDRLWVRETWGGDDLCGFAYRADHPDWPIFRGDGDQPDSPWRPSIYMPRIASRILLEVTNVRVERLREITEADARAEGIPGPHDAGYPAYSLPEDSEPRYSSAVAAYKALWDSINGKRAPWVSNPWVWAVSFKRVEKSDG